MNRPAGEIVRDRLAAYGRAMHALRHDHREPPASDLARGALATLERSGARWTPMRGDITDGVRRVAEAANFAPPRPVLEERCAFTVCVLGGQLDRQDEADAPARA